MVGVPGYSFTMHHDAVFLVCDEYVSHPLATGFCFIKPEWVVTAKHAVVEMGATRTSLVLFSRGHGMLRASVAFLHPTHDLAVLRIEGQSPCDVPLFPGYEGYAGQNWLVACGFAPSLGGGENPNHTILLSKVASYEREERTRNSGDESLIVFDLPGMEGGHSGGPVFGEGGVVVAVLIELIRSDTGPPRARATSVLHLLRHLAFENT